MSLSKPKSVNFRKVTHLHPVKLPVLLTGFSGPPEPGRGVAQKAVLLEKTIAGRFAGVPRETTPLLNPAVLHDNFTWPHGRAHAVPVKGCVRRPYVI